MISNTDISDLTCAQIQLEIDEIKYKIASGEIETDVNLPEFGNAIPQLYRLSILEELLAVKIYRGSK